VIAEIRYVIIRSHQRRAVRRRGVQRIAAGAFAGQVIRAARGRIDRGVESSKYTISLVFFTNILPQTSPPVSRDGFLRED
jgi:hypothetical protein